jgi:hypothetical protein
MVQDAEKLTAMGRSSHQRAEEWLAPARVASQTVSLYRSVIAAFQSD